MMSPHLNYVKVGNHGGVIRGKKYFECPETHGIFVKADKAIPIRGSLTRTMSKVFSLWNCKKICH
jgi:dynactin complex subunit